MTETQNANILARIGVGAYGIGSYIIKGIAKSLGIMAMQMFIMLAISLPFAIVIGIGALITGTGLHVVAMAVPLGMLLTVLIAVAGISSLDSPPTTSTRSSAGAGRSRGGRRSSRRSADDPDEALKQIRERGMEAMLESDVERALEDAGENVAYSGPYTGPGPSTTQMYERAGFPDLDSLFFEDRDARENRFSFRKFSRSPGPASRRLSFHPEEHKSDETDNAVFAISVNRSAGTPDDYLIVEETRTDEEQKL